jgi:hypothetical protein
MLNISSQEFNTPVLLVIFNRFEAVCRVIDVYPLFIKDGAISKIIPPKNTHEQKYWLTFLQK